MRRRSAWMTGRVPGLLCACGGADIIAVSPGAEGNDLFSVDRSVPTVAWRLDCWPAAPAAPAAATDDQLSLL